MVAQKDRVVAENVAESESGGTGEEGYSQLDAIANIAEVANAVASLLVGHRRILVDGGFDVNLADGMCAALHAKLLGIGPVWEFDFDDDSSWVDQEDEE